MSHLTSTDKSYDQEFHMVKTRQITNLEKMKTRNMKIQAHYSLVKAIVNISKRQLTTPEKSVLNKGLNFATTIKRIPWGGAYGAMVIVVGNGHGD